MLLIVAFSQFVYADEEFCKVSGKLKYETFVDFSNKFCFSSESFMKTFALALYDSNIPFVVYSNGHIGYRIEDSAQVQKVGDKLVHDYLSNRKK